MKKWPKIKIFVAHHKPWYIYEDDVYVPIQVWKKKAKVDLWILWDDTWDNISEKNSNYAELTAQYWVWKNYDLSNVDYVWFCHYRRYMTYCYRPNLCKYLFMKKTRNEKIQLRKEGNALFNYNKDILKKNSINLINYIINNPYDLYTSKREIFITWKLRNFLWIDVDSFLDFCTVRWADFGWQRKDKPKEIFLNLYPHYESIIRDIEEESKEYFPLHRHIFVMKKDLFLDYVDWLFKYLFELEKYINKHHLQTEWIYWKWEKRFMWILGERLINYWKLYLEKENWIKVSSKSHLIFFAD